MTPNFFDDGDKKRDLIQKITEIKDVLGYLKQQLFIEKELLKVERTGAQYIDKSCRM
ncbi:hypothetical protein GWI33_009761, partial [Rhynchophorus ferrugineus]